MPLPKRIQNAPALIMGLELYLQAWLDLSSCRDHGFGEGPIPWSEVRDYGLTLGMNEDEIEDLQYLMRSMDTAYFKHRAEKRKDGKPG